MEKMGWLIDLIKPILPFLRRHLLVISVFVAALGWALTLLPERTFEVLNIRNLRSTHLEEIGAMTFISTFGFCFGMIFKSFVYVRRKWADRQESVRRQELLSALTGIEYERLYKYVEGQSQTATFSLFDGVVAGLVEKGILHKPESQANKAGEQDFNLCPWAYDYLNAHREFFTRSRA